MKVTCILTANELGPEKSDLIVFPEGASQKDMEHAQSSRTDTIIVGAFEDNGYSRGVLLHRGKNRINYLKVDADNKTEGSGDVKQMPLYEFEDMCIGVLICKDIDNEGISHAVVANIRSSPANLKLLCIPADMGSHWFNDSSLPFPEKFRGIQVILCNHIKSHQARGKGLLTDAQGKKIVVQQDMEPIYAELP
ncbi:hypothetical protein MNBD_GAMMA19-1816 [hydrothermal vent metagenome]|uniref:CN hydrolase domain-containing protein n=1 Tax=hydrothermal vent metagenome TaxID=652676 RepID=A0A3B1AIJ7_9ZZZZ